MSDFISVTVDTSRFTRRTQEMQRQVPIDWQHWVRDTAKQLASDLSGKSAIGKVKATDQKAGIARDVNRAAKGLGSNGWKNPEIKRYIEAKDWRRLEAKLTWMRSTDRRIQSVQAHGLKRFTPSMHKQARNNRGRVPKSYDSHMVVPNDGDKKRHKKESQGKRGALRAGWWPAAQALGARRGFPAYVTKHGTSLGSHYDGTHTASPFFVLRNSAPGVLSPWFRKSFDWFAKRRADMARRAVKKMVEHTYRKFNAGQTMTNSYTGQPS